MISFLFVDTERVWRGGQDQLLTLLKGLCLRGHTVHLICHPGTLLEERSRDAGVHVYPASLHSGGAAVSFFRMLRVLLKARPDILAFNTPKPILTGNLASRFSTVKARLIFRRVNFPLHRNPITRLKYNRGIDCIIAISESIRSQLQVGGVSPSRIRTIYEGMDLTSYPRRESPRLRQPGDPLVVGTVAHLSPEKGLYYLVEAAALIPDVHTRLRFVLVGDGECRPALENQVRDRGLESCFHFAGFQNRPARYLETFDIFVLPSLSEGLSSAILTAMATSLPVIATDVGGIPELVTSGENGILVPPGDPISLGEAIQELADDPLACFRMGQQGRSRVEERFTIERKIQETEALCASFLGRPAPVSRAAHA
jgi:glycosyltransferase involved in cell wall biosynthesis